MDDVHDVREIQRAVDALGPTAVAAEELACARVSQQSFHRLFEIHVPQRLRHNCVIPNGVYP